MGRFWWEELTASHISASEAANGTASMLCPGVHAHGNTITLVNVNTTPNTEELARSYLRHAIDEEVGKDCVSQGSRGRSQSRKKNRLSLHSDG